MERSELLSSPEFWMTKIQNELFNQIMKFMEDEGINKTQLAKRLGFSKGYITQVLNGDFDHRISKLVKMSLAIGLVPKVEWSNLENIIISDRERSSVLTVEYFTQKSDIGTNNINIGDLNRTKTIALQNVDHQITGNDSNQAV